MSGPDPGDRWVEQMRVDARGWPVVETATALGGLVVGAPSPWHAGPARQTPGELEVVASHPDGARMRIRHTIEETWDIRITLTSTAAVPLEVPGPLMRFETATPVHAWTGGADGLIVGAPTAGAPVAGMGEDGCLVLRQVSGDSTTSDDGVLPLGARIVLQPGASVSASWRGHTAAGPGRLFEDLPQWLPRELIETDGTEIRCETPDAGLLLDGAETDGEDLLAPAGLHELEVRQARGTTRLALGWSPSIDTVLRIRGEEIMGGLDVRRADGPRLWILTRAVDGGAVVRSATAMVDEALENLLSRPGAGLFTVLTALTRASATGDMDIWRAGLDALARLDARQPCTLMAHALAFSLARIGAGPAPEPLAPPSSQDPLVTAEWSMLSRPGPRPDAASLEALWLLGAAAPSPAAGPLLDAGGRVPALRTAHAVAVTSMWPEWWDTRPSWGDDAATLRQRAVRRLLAQDHLDDEALALLAW